MSNIRNHSTKDFARKRLLLFAVMLLVQCVMCHVFAQITIGGNVYGGGNEGNLGESTSVVIRQADIKGSVFGGACQANVDGSTFVHIDGQHMSGDITINAVYGGNDVSGTIGTSAEVPSELTKAATYGLTDATGTDAGKNKEDYNTFILTTKERTAGTGETQHYIFVGQMFGGGNGAYDYTHSKVLDEDGVATAEDNPYYGKSAPRVGKTYQEILGGTFGYVFAGGNNATVTGAADICIANESTPMTSNSDLTLPASVDLTSLATELEYTHNQRLMDMGINFTTFQRGYNFQRVFGGNNLAAMHIRPTWHLEKGSIVDLFSGGNEGNMTSADGILMHVPSGSQITALNVFGGCRKADVHPENDEGTFVPQVPKLESSDYSFPAGYSARVLIQGGNITNVYGGNDISGNVYGGNAVGIHVGIAGDVYGGGNGSYAYTDNDAFANDILWGDYYYAPGSNSVEALNDFRPNAEKVSIRLKGSDADHPTIIHGGVYCGGNSATLKNDAAAATAQLKIGSYVIADKVFLGNNGEKMVDPSEGGVLWQYQQKLYPQKGKSMSTELEAFSTLDLTNTDTFASYMEGCAMSLRPEVVFDTYKADGTGDPVDYVPYSTSIGSLFCGGNVGSMTYSGTATMDFSKSVIIYEKVVGGCNNAYVPEQYYTSDGTQKKLNAEYLGGIIGSAAERWPAFVDGGNIKNRLILNFNGLKIQPKRWAGTKDASGNYTEYFKNEKGNAYLIWNTFSAATDEEVEPVTTITYDQKKNDEGNPIEGELETYESSDDADLDRRLKGGNIYGGCYNSGHVNGNVVINVNQSVMDRTGEFAIFDQVVQNEGEAILYENDGYEITERHSGVILDEQGMDVLGTALNMFGGGYGEDAEIWGSTTINLQAGYVFQIFGGGEKGPVGRHDNSGAYTFAYTKNGVEQQRKYNYDSRFSCYINVCGDDAGVYRGHADDKPNMAETEFIYGGAFFAPVAGNTIINLGNGRVFNTFAGSCNADILGHTETYVGRNTNSDSDLGFPWIRDHIYGGNDLGGRIMGMDNGNFYNRVISSGKVYRDPTETGTTPNVTNASTYIEYLQGRVVNIFGGCYGVYDYTDSHYKDYAYATESTGQTDANLGKARPGFIKPRLNNAFVNIRPENNSRNEIARVYGAGQGYTGDSDRDVMQNRSYVLIDIPQGLTLFRNMDVFGAGDFCGLGMHSDYYTTTNGYDATKDNGITYDAAKADPLSATAVIDLARGHIRNVYGGSYNEGVTRRTLVNVPQESTIQVSNIFGGAYGVVTNNPCDVYEANVNYSSDAAMVSNALYGGNNNERRTVYGRVKISTPVWSDKSGGYLAKVYGAGLGGNTWSEYTEVDLESGARVYEVYGGGQQGKVHNAESIQKFMNDYHGVQPASAWSLGHDYYVPVYSDDSYNYASNDKTNLENSDLVREAEMDDRYNSEHEHYAYASDSEKKFQNKYNANVLIKEGATVENYAYGGGYGADAVVAGTTYIALLGGEVAKDIYAAGTRGSVEDLHNAGNFVASTNVYIQGGTVRNVYGGGWRGSVGHHVGTATDPNSTTGDVLGESHVVIGNTTGTTHANGVPSITRNVYGGGEGGAIYGTAYVTLNNGYIGYRYNSALADDSKTELDDRYVAEVDDKPGDRALEEHGGNVFGGGYVANSYVDITDVNMYDGIVRGGLYGGGEVGPVGRGTVHADSLSKPSIANVAGYLRPRSDTDNTPIAAIYKGGETYIDLYGGHVMRDVFGGGRGYDNWGGEGYYESDEEKLAMDRSSKGFVFGKTQVHIHAGEIGTAEGALHGYGNVFGGGDEGFVFSATGRKVGQKESDNTLVEGKPSSGGGYYYDSYTKGSGGKLTSLGNLTRDCIVDITPFCKVIDENGITIGSTTFAEGEYVEVDDLNKLRNRKHDKDKWAKLNTDGIIIHNAVFAGGNITEGSDIVSASTVTVYGNAGASLRDVYNLDLITLGSDEIGGLYGDGNLTLVDGFRELHIDNYGTDKYSLDDAMPLSVEAGSEDETYYDLTERQRAYYKLKYVLKDKTAAHTYRYYESLLLHTYEYTTNDDGVETTHSATYRKGQKITFADYANLSTEEKAKWIQGSKTFQKDEQIEEGEWFLMDATEQDLWELYGVCSIYAGRPLNTIQRADMCGVFGSRMVLKGAQDRVPETVDYTDYTINRVDEVSLNKRTSIASGDEGDAVNKEHGNYFGIYSVVNYLGNLTSDVFFEDPRKTDSSDANNYASTTLNGTTTTYGETPGSTTYHDWKAARPTSKNRNNGTSHNKVALASGVYLEIKREQGAVTTTDTDDWGFITGVVELDLINVMQGMGGGYVYARNEHGVKTWHGTGSAAPWGKVTMLDYNTTARTYRHYEYTESTKENIETSGNFVHNTKQIVDDCYPNGGVYNDGYVKSPAHYWFVKGSIYVYDQYISAYTGAANAYAEQVDLPLTISAASHGKLTLREVQPNYYAYYDKNGNKLGSMVDNQMADTIYVANNITYKLNDPISYWNYNLLTEDEKNHFVRETYITTAACTLNNVVFPADSVLLLNEYESLRGAALTGKLRETDTEEVKYVLDAEDNRIAFDKVFRPSNNLGHETGYILTYDVNNPGAWNNYYTQTNSPGTTLSTKEYNNQANYTEGPTYKLKDGVLPNDADGAVLGQNSLKPGSIVYESVVTDYESNVYSRLSASQKDDQATVEQAWVVTKTIEMNEGGEMRQLNVGTPIIQSDYTEDEWASFAGKIEEAQVCTGLLQFSTTDFVYAGKVLSSADVATLKTKVIDKFGFTDDGADDPTLRKTALQKAEEFLISYLDKAYYCKSPGRYGGIFVEKDKAYDALSTFCSMSEEERDMLVFNYDALDLLIDPTYDGRDEGRYGNKPQYDGYDPTKKDDATPQYEGSTPLSPKVYSVEQPIDYQAEYMGEEDNLEDAGGKYKEYTLSDGTKQKIYVNPNQEGWWSPEDYEKIPNEKHHYTPITVTAPGTYYVVKEPFMRGDIPYTVGQVIDYDLYSSLTDQQQGHIDSFTFTSSHVTQKKQGDDPVYLDAEGNETTEVTDKPVYLETYYYYCRESYTVNEYGEGKDVTTMGIKAGTTSTKYGTAGDAESAVVPRGVIIDKTNYDALPNYQTGFVIHGVAPTETSTLYVSSESDIFNLKKEKIITVIYLYEYEESDELGMNVTPVSERHIVNIHINFKAGIPEIGKLKKPDIVLPGTTIGLEIPTVTEGAYRVTNSGWQIFAKQSDANTCTNGQEYYNNVTPVYWYQNNYWVAYYAETYLGKTFSAPVQFSVANYHDLKKVMDAKSHHYYIDHVNNDYEPKIYISDYSSSQQNGADLLKDLYDLSLMTTEPEEGSKLAGHRLLDERVKGGQGLEFILRTNIDHTDAETHLPLPWTPIAGEKTALGDYVNCFSGNFHGDGHTISGLTNSLFGKLCGSVYNLGVTGSFTSAGVVDTGEGYVENCWVKSTATSLPEGTGKVNAVFGSPSDETGKQVVNSYFWDGNKNLYNTITSNGNLLSGGERGYARAMSDTAFYNGTVAYDLNGFYLYKRFCDNTGATGTDYKYYTVNDDKTLSAPKSGHYGENVTWCSSGYNDIKYVEDRFADGDFRYAAGTIPDTEDERAYVDTSDGNKVKFYPIWPDDYLFFGQMLTYDYSEEQPHQEMPSAVVRTGGRLLTTHEGNRVYRAPAYFRSKQMGVAHFNPWANLAAYSKPETPTDPNVKPAYPNMTAIDFAGHNDTDYQLGLTGSLFYQPLLDDDGLSSVANNGETSNLLVYAPAETSESGYANKATYDVLTDYFQDQAYHHYDETLDDDEDDGTDKYKRYTDGKQYGRIAINTSSIHGHLVQSDLKTATDHLLVDGQDFNCPIAYDFGDGYRMWYQRTADRYVNSSNSGWDAVSLPFQAEVVTTHQKGEITHFYQGSIKGHEYWLREFKPGGQVSADDANVYVANLTYPDAGSTPKTYTNDFLWDYYYQHNARDDKNGDDYQDDFYKSKKDDDDKDYVQKYDKYPRLASATPYIIGFPGSRYYEFDLSGQFVARTAKSDVPVQLRPQTITFASAPSHQDDYPVLTIGVSDDEMAGVSQTIGGKTFTFKPNYLYRPLVTKGQHGFTLNSTGDSFVENATANTVQVNAFRPYFEAVAPSAAPGSAPTRSIMFSNISSQLGGDEQLQDKQGENVVIYAEKRNIVVTSGLRTTTDVRIFNVSGLCVASFTIEPGQTIETPIHVAGIYVVHADGGRYTKKLSVRQ